MSKEELNKSLSEANAAGDILWAISSFLDEVSVQAGDVEVMYKCQGFISDLKKQIEVNKESLHKQISELEKADEKEPK